MRKLAVLLVTLSFLITTSAQALTAKERIAERLKPVGWVCIEGDDSCGGTAEVSSSGGTRTSEEIYTAKCSVCHGIGLAGAPKFGTSDWAERAKKGMETLLTSSINGLNAMPARGTCVDCSDDELKGAVEYMVNSAK